MKTIGMVGALAPNRTVDYYRLLIAAYRELHPDGTYPAILIDRVDLKTVLDLVSTDQRPRLVEFLGTAVDALARAGAQVGFLASNTPHLVFDEIACRSPIPLVSIVESALDRASTLGLKRVGLFGTRFTMQASFYASAFEQMGIEVVAPQPQEQDYIHEKYLGELVAGMRLPETRAGLLEIAHLMKERDGVEALILGGTELPPILRGENDASIPFLDTAQLHVDAVIAAAAGSYNGH